MRKFTYTFASGILWLLTSGPAHAEMHKGDSMAPFIWGVFLITAVIPGIMGLVICWLLARITGKRPKRAVTVLTALLSWWLGIHIAMQDRNPAQEFNELWIVFWTAVLSAGMAYMSTFFTDSDEPTQ
ncbi:hypothetical protein D0N36_09685 [Hymenobacter lapidiphilus]|uniref:hypothetical protein n=1 Tax=Hymenobacter sp. CCM 8763 TaxID=2303334 RepID=UPI000E355630|nr:hypothetical protein [Hymenobacter sp. CCM 8763]RFP65321.1 hypothetical protein D0N36_09685 [Hymenobacter sp. CCM 8763]